MSPNESRSRRLLFCLTSSYLTDQAVYSALCFADFGWSSIWHMARKPATSKFAKWIWCLCHIRVLGRNDSIKGAISIMKPKQIFNSILAVPFVFPLMGTFAQQAATSGSIEVRSEERRVGKECRYRWAWDR